MIRANENALTPASLATDGNQGESAKTLGPCEGEHSVQEAQARVLALFAINAARELLDSYGRSTDAPQPGVVEAADCLDAAAQYLSLLSDFPELEKQSAAGGE